MFTTPKIKFDKNLLLNVFITLNLVFSFYTVNFFIGNHDWDWVKGTTQILSWDTGLFEARFSKFILNVVLFSGHIIPILNNLVSFLLASLGMVMVVDYIKLQDKFLRFIVAISPLISPYILGWMYFSINILGNFSALPLVVGGLIFLEKKSVLEKFIAVICLILAFGIYPSTIETMFILYASKNIINPPQKLKQSLVYFLYLMGVMLIFKLLLFIMTRLGIIYETHYNMQTNTLSNIIQNIPIYLKIFTAQLYVTLPFFPLSLKVICLISIIIAFVTGAVANPKTIIFWFLSFASTILSTMLTLNYTEASFLPRINFYGLNFLYMTSFAVMLLQKNILKNLGLLLSVSYLFISLNQDFYAQKVWELGRHAEINQVMRITDRIENKTTEFPLIPILTDTISLRPKYYLENYSKPSPYILNDSFTIRHIPSGIYNFYSPQKIFSTHSKISSQTKELHDYLSTVSAVWPKEEALYIDETYAIIIMSSYGLNAIKLQIPK